MNSTTGTGDSPGTSLTLDSTGLDQIRVRVHPDGRLDTANAAAYCGLSSKTMANFRWRGIGPKFSKRGRVFYGIEDLNDWLAAGRTFGSTAQARLAKASTVTPIQSITGEPPQLMSGG